MPSDVHTQTGDGPEVQRAGGTVPAGSGMDEMVELFARELPGRIAELRAQWARGEHDAVRSSSHLLAGSATMYGLDPIASAARALEQSLLTMDAHDGSGAVARRIDGLVSVCQEMIGSA